MTDKRKAVCQKHDTVYDRLSIDCDKCPEKDWCNYVLKASRLDTEEES